MEIRAVKDGKGTLISMKCQYCGMSIEDFFRDLEVSTKCFQQNEEISRNGVMRLKVLSRRPPSSFPSSFPNYDPYMCPRGTNNGFTAQEHYFVRKEQLVQEEAVEAKTEASCPDCDKSMSSPSPTYVRFNNNVTIIGCREHIKEFLRVVAGMGESQEEVLE